MTVKMCGRTRAREMIDRWCNDPTMWGTHGRPSEEKLARIENDITYLLDLWRVHHPSQKLSPNEERLRDFLQNKVIYPE